MYIFWRFFGCVYVFWRTLAAIGMRNACTNRIGSLPLLKFLWSLVVRLNSFFTTFNYPAFPCSCISLLIRSVLLTQQRTLDNGHTIGNQSRYLHLEVPALADWMRHLEQFAFIFAKYFEFEYFIWKILRWTWRKIK